MADVVLVTGASTGLGLAVAQALRDTDYRLLLTARASSLPRFAAAGLVEGERIRLRALDVTDDVQRRTVVAEAEAAWGGVDVLINNAGIAYRAVIEHAGPGDLAEQLAVNFTGALQLIQLVLPGMRARGRGRIINVSSVSGMLAMPALGLYSASKFALEGASESLWYELRPFGIHVTLLQPGFIRSDSFRNTRFSRLSMQAMQDAGDPYHAHYRHMDAFIARLMHASPADAGHVARTILKVMRMRHPPLRMAATPDAHLFALLRRFLPRQLFHRFLYRRLPHIASWGGAR